MRKVLTVGVFDFLHIGHVNLFKKAKELGDYLIVAVQNEESIRKYKQVSNIEYSTIERVFMVESIRYVDEVIVYDSVDSLLGKVDFDVFAKGPDQSHSGFVNFVNWCEENNKDVVVIPRTENISSTLLRNNK